MAVDIAVQTDAIKCRGNSIWVWLVRCFFFIYSHSHSTVYLLHLLKKKNNVLFFTRVFRISRSYSHRHCYSHSYSYSFLSSFNNLIIINHTSFTWFLSMFLFLARRSRRLYSYVPVTAHSGSRKNERVHIFIKIWWDF